MMYAQCYSFFVYRAILTVISFNYQQCTSSLRLNIYSLNNTSFQLYIRTPTINPVNVTRKSCNQSYVYFYYYAFTTQAVARM